MNKRKTRIELTDSGRAILIGTGFIALAALVVPAFGVLAALVSVLLVALVAGFILRPRIRVEPQLPDRIVAGQNTHIKYTIHNLGRLPIYNLYVRPHALPKAVEAVDPARTIPHVPPGRTAEVLLRIRPNRRGHHTIPAPQCTSSFPFNLFSFGAVDETAETLIVLPTFSRLLLASRYLSRHVRYPGLRIGAHTGACPEYAGNRPFLPGDTLRNIDARAWARLSVPATKEYYDDVDNYTALILDTAVAANLLARSQEKEIESFEAAVSLCASVAFSINDNCLIDLLAVGDDLHTFTGRPRSARLDAIHTLLAAVQPVSAYFSQQTAEILTERFAELSEAFFILQSWSDPYRRLIEIARRSGCRCTVLLVGDADNVETAPGRASEIETVRSLSPHDILGGHLQRL